MQNSCDNHIANMHAGARLPAFRWMLVLSVPLLLITMLWMTTHNNVPVAQAAGTVSYVGTCTALTPLYGTIQAAVDNAAPGAVINICPGTYPESVNLSDMSAMGNITLQRLPGISNQVLIAPTLDYGIGIDGEATFIGNITIESIDIAAQEGHGINFGDYRNVQGNVIISNVNARDNFESGAMILATGDIRVENSSFNDNGSYGLYLSADGNIDVLDSTAHANGSSLTIGDENTGIWVGTGGYYATCGIEATDADPRVNLESVEASGNYGWGINIEVERSVYITNTIVISNAYDGVAARTYNDVCANTPSKIQLSSSIAISNGWFVQDYATNDVEVQIPLLDPYGGFRLVGEATINVSSDTVAEQNGHFGYCLYSYTETLVTGAQAVNNGGDGFLYGADCRYYGYKALGEPETPESEVDITGIGLPPSLTITNSSAISNTGTGFAIAESGSSIALVNVSTLNNINGVSFAEPRVNVGSLASNDYTAQDALNSGPTTIQNSLIQGNSDYGILYGQPVYAPAGIQVQAALAFTSTHLVNSSILCENSAGLGAVQYPVLTSTDTGIQDIDEDFLLLIDARGNWWGSATGPTTPANPGGTGDSIETELINPSTAAFTREVQFDPWVNTIHANATPNPTIYGVPVALEYQFSDTLLSYFLQNGVGDPNNGPLFNLSATNGTVDSTGKFLANTWINGTATPEAPGIMAVTLDGPCGLDSTLNVLAATPAIDITKSPDIQGVAAGETATFTVTVVNSGNITLTNITVNDPIAPACSRATGALGDLGVGASTTYSCTLVVNNNLVNSITAQGFALVGGVGAGTPVSDVDTAEVLLASISFIKTAFVDGYREFTNGSFNPSSCALNSNITVPVNSTVKYCYTITNTGSYTVSTHTLVDNHFPNPILSNFPREVGPGQSFSTVDAGIEVTKTLVTGFTNVANWTAEIAPPINEISTRSVNAVNPVVSSSTAATVNISTPDLDQDADGIPDNVEGTGDVDADGIPNYLDPTTPTGLDDTDQPKASDSIFLPSVVR